MTKEQAIIEILKKDYCLTGFQINGFVYRNYNIKISPQFAATALRPLIADGLISKFPDPSSGKMVYWITDKGKKVL